MLSNYVAIYHQKRAPLASPLSLGYGNVKNCVLIGDCRPFQNSLSVCASHISLSSITNCLVLGKICCHLLLVC